MTMTKNMGIKTILVVVAGAMFLASGTTFAQIITLTDGNSKVEIDPDSQAGTYLWSVNGPAGNFDHLAQQWFWYRIAGVAEQSIDTIGGKVVQKPLPNLAVVTYNNGTIQVKVTYTLTGGGAGQLQSTLTESVSVTNVSGAPYTVDFFQYSNFDLYGTPNDDTGKFLQPQQIVQKDTTSGNALSETVVSGIGDLVGHEIQFVTPAVPPDLLTRLTDGVATNLGAVNGPLAGDVAWGFQWRRLLNPLHSLTFSKDKNITVPAPGAVLLGVIGLGLVSRVRNRRRRA